MSETDRVEDLLIELTTELPEHADALTRIRTHLRALQGQARQRDALGVLAKAVEDVAREADHWRPVMQQASDALGTIAAARVAVAETSGKRWEAWVDFVKSPPAVGTLTLAGAALAYGLARLLGVVQYLPGGAP